MNKLSVKRKFVKYYIPYYYDKYGEIVELGYYIYILRYNGVFIYLREEEFYEFSTIVTEKGDIIWL